MDLPVREVVPSYSLGMFNQSQPLAVPSVTEMYGAADALILNVIYSWKRRFPFH